MDRGSVRRLDDDDDDEAIVYFNNAGMARFSPAVRDAGIRCLQEQLAGYETNAESQVRVSFAKLIEADPSRIALMASTAFAVTLAAENLKASLFTRSGKILLLQDQFASAVYPWQNVCAASNDTLTLAIIPNPATSSSLSTLSWTDLIIDRLENDNDIVVACLPPLHWADGHWIDLETISTICQRRNIPLIIDATQAVGAIHVSVPSLQPAMLVCSCHKWLRGCSGYALAYIDPAYQDVWHPLDQHARGRSVEHNTDHMGPNGYTGEFYKDARKFDCGGRPNPVLLPMLQTALDEVVALNVDELQATLKELLLPLLEWAETSGKFTVPKHHAYHLVGLRPTSPMSIDQMTGVANELLKTKKIHIAVRCGTFRISPYLDTTKEDVQILIEGLAEACRN